MSTMTYPDKTKTMNLLIEWQAHHLAVTQLMDGARSSIGIDPDGPFFCTVWRLFDGYTAALSVTLGAEFDLQIKDHGINWLAWFASDNGMGEKAYKAGYDGQHRAIKTLDDLYWLIEQARVRA